MQKLITTTKSKIPGGLYLTSFYKNVQNLKYNICMYVICMYVSSDFGWYSIHFDIVY